MRPVRWSGVLVLAATAGLLLAFALAPGGAGAAPGCRDGDGDGVCDDADNCPADVNTGQEDEDEDGVGDVCDDCISGDDGDGDGLCDIVDLCPDTAIPEAVPTRSLEPNHFALVDDDGDFDTVGGGAGRHFTVEDTAGCSCDQIIAALGLGGGPRKFGCSAGVMDEWLAAVAANGCEPECEGLACGFDGCNGLCGACPAGERCEAGRCVSADPCALLPDCDDGRACTDDRCEPFVGCVHAPSPDGAGCDDGNPCTTEDHCFAGRCVGGVVPECTTAPCVSFVCLPESGWGFVPGPDGDPCDDGDPCTFGDVCRAGQCTNGGLVDCDDGDPCTRDWCEWGTCLYAFDWEACPGQGPCCEVHEAPGCEQPAVMACVCDYDPYCCSGWWHEGCVDLARWYCGADCGWGCQSDAECDDADPCTFDRCGPDGSCRHERDPACAGTDPCCTGHDSPGCDDPAVQACVCADQPWCCQRGWYGECVVAALRCGAQCPGEGPCCAEHPTPGCDDPATMACVCEYDWGCCLGAWYPHCAVYAMTQCGAECPMDGACCEEHPTPGCEDAAVAACVCQYDWECCLDSWRPRCREIAFRQCNAPCEPECLDAAACDDGNACTRDLCRPPGYCVHERDTACFMTEDCCTAHESPGCVDRLVTGCVCANNPWCCSDRWYPECAWTALTQCGAPCEFEGSCCEAHDGFGCEDPAVTACVCGANPWCCFEEFGWGWSEDCVAFAWQRCGAGCPPDCAADGDCDDGDDCTRDWCEAPGVCRNEWSPELCPPSESCCEAHPWPGCDDGGVTECVCGDFRECCEDSWMPHCVMIAKMVCGLLCGDCTPEEDPDACSDGIDNDCDGRPDCEDAFCHERFPELCGGCPEGLTWCPDGCFGLDWDRNHCGGCDDVCPPGSVCEWGVCRPGCNDNAPCDDGDPCTEDNCRADTMRCEFVEIPGCGAGCETDADCPAGTACVGGRCVAARVTLRFAVDDSANRTWDDAELE
jgi:hypothetical protein